MISTRKPAEFAPAGDDPVLDFLIERGQAVRVNEAKQAVKDSPALESLEPEIEVLVPFIYFGELIAVMALPSPPKGHFSDEDLHLLDGLAVQASPSIKLTVLQDSVAEMVAEREARTRRRF